MTKAVDTHFQNKFTVIKQRPQPTSGPWHDTPPLKAKPKQIDADDPDRIGG